jgi:DNA-nicking Smr family endonuclease
MSRGGGRSGSRHVTPNEAALWRQATRSLDKVKAKPRVSAHAAEVAPARSTETYAGGAAKARRPGPVKQNAPPPASSPPQTVPLAEFDRRGLRQVASGKVAIDAVLDLHGLRQGDAHARLRAFLARAQAQGHRMLLVITGKGGEAETGDYLASVDRPGRGILRRSVPQWLEEPGLRAIVLSYTAASPRHGGNGALYVRLRKARKT